MNMSEQCYIFPAAHSHKNMQLVQNKTHIERARIIQKSLGTLLAARYMAKRNWSLESALSVLVGR